MRGWPGIEDACGCENWNYSMRFYMNISEYSGAIELPKPSFMWLGVFTRVLAEVLRDFSPCTSASKLMLGLLSTVEVPYIEMIIPMNPLSITC